MHKCKWCSNKSNNTKENRPGVKLYAIPKNENIRRKWLKIFGTDSCNDWEPMCSDHFQNYMPEKKQILFSKAIPQSYDRNGFPSNYAIQSNDVETGSNIILPMEQNITREEHIGNAGVNSFKSPRRSSRLTRNRARNNEDMRSGQMPDHTLGSGLQCSVKNCMNRLSKNLSLFGYPKDITLRKLWIRKCGIKTDATKKVMSSTRVCSIHFEPGCFKNSKLKNRLKPGAVPSLFLDNENSGVKTDDDNTVMISSKVNNSHFELYIFKNTELKNKLKEGHVPYLVFDNEKCGVTTDAAKIETSRTRVCRTHLDLNCFKKYILKKTFQTSAVPLFLNNDNTDNTSMTIDLTIDDSSNSSLSITSEPIEERTSQCIMDVCKTNNKSWSENKNNGNDNTDNTSMIIDLTIDDSSNSSLSITLEPIEERTSQCIMDVCKTNNKSSSEKKNNGNDIINTKNFPSTSSCVNRWIFH